MSQGAFAEKAGIHRNTQVRYESGKREPDPEYLTRVQNMGVDAGYLLFGRKTDRLSVYHLAATRVLPAIGEKAGFSSGALLGILDVVADEESAIWGGGKFERDDLQMSALIDAFCENGDLLADVFEGVRHAIHEHGLSLTYRQRAKTVTMLYRTFKPSGRVEKVMIEEAVKLAAD
jgi:transcriptional regulator with XRE-family HTH domain